MDFVLGKKLYVLSKIKRLSQAINKNKSAFKAVSTFDETFIPSLMQAIDIKIQLFIALCAQEDNIEDVKYRILDFTNEVNCILIRKSIGISLPSLVKQATGGGGKHHDAKPGKRSNDSADDHAGPNTKRKASSSPTKNSSPVDPGWIISTHVASSYAYRTTSTQTGSATPKRYSPRQPATRGFSTRISKRCWVAYSTQRQSYRKQTIS